MKIGVFDSGVGGITVLTELRKAFPGASYIYLGDTANVPYGTKSHSQIKQLSCGCAHLLKSRGIDALVVACNTASSVALEAIKEVMGSIPVFGVVEPGADAAAAGIETFDAPDSLVLVLATSATVRSGAYGKALKRKQEELKSSFPVVELACPLLVPMIEEGWVDHPILHLTVAEYVKKFASGSVRGVALLGCTHYPWIQSAFQQALPGWKIVNSARAVADSLSRSPLVSRLSIAGSRKSTEWIFTDPDAVPSFVRSHIDADG